VHGTSRPIPGFHGRRVPAISRVRWLTTAGGLYYGRTAARPPAESASAAGAPPPTGATPLGLPPHLEPGTHQRPDWDGYRAATGMGAARPAQARDHPSPDASG
jgi:hypothetical protein